MSTSFDLRMQRKAEAHLAACNETLYDEAEQLGESPAFAPYCGCETCVVREVLSVVWDDFIGEAQRVVAAS